MGGRYPQVQSGIRPVFVKTGIALRVALFAYNCIPNAGSEFGIGWQFVEMAARHHDVTVFTPASNRAAIEAVELEFAPRFEYVPLRERFGPIGIGRGWFDAVHCMVWYSRAVESAGRQHSRLPFDLAHQVTMSAYWMPTPLYRLGVPLLVGPLSGGETVDPALRSSQHWTTRLQEWGRCRALDLATRSRRWRFTVKGSRSLVVTTTYTVDDKLRRRGVENTVRFRPTYALPEGLLRELESIGRSEAKADRPTFALSGRQIAWKGQLYALRALAIVRERLPDVQLHLIGDGADHHLLLAEIERLGLGDCVMVHRTADRTEERRLIAGSHALVSASTRDGGSSLLQFAMALETMIVGLDVGVVSQIVGSDAVLISPDPSSTVVERLADAMIDVWVNEERRHELETRARERLTTTLSFAEVEASLDHWYERAARL